MEAPKGNPLSFLGSFQVLKCMPENAAKEESERKPIYLYPGHSDSMWPAFPELSYLNRNLRAVSDIIVQRSAVTLTPSAIGKSVTISDCHSKRSFFPK